MDKYKYQMNGEAMRLDRFVAESGRMTRSQAQRLIGDSLVTVNGQTQTKPSHKLRDGDIVEVDTAAARRPLGNDNGLIAEDIPLDIVYSDDDLVVVNKPAGMVVYPAAGHNTGTLVNALKYRFDKLCPVGGPLRPGIVHRLDKDTSGLMVVALSEAAYYSLVEQFKTRSINRRYVTLVNGIIKENEGRVELSIGRSRADRKKMSTRGGSCAKPASTGWKAIRRFDKCATMINARLSTGRTHQIRVHMAAIGHPVLGDQTYGHKTFIEYRGVKIKFPRQMLHAELLGFTHPIGGGQMEFVAPMPDDMKEAVKALEEIA